MNCSSNNTYVAYYRVSTAKQGLGLDAQAQLCRNHELSTNSQIIGEFVEKESGKNADRPELRKALQLCRERGATLLVAKLDRLTRDVVFGFELRRQGVDFLALDCPELNTITLGVMLSLAQQERELISQRTRQALAVLKSQGKRLGTPANLDDNARARGRAKHSENARENANNRRASALARALRQGGATLQTIANELTNGGYPTARGGKKWTKMQVKRLLERD